MAYSGEFAGELFGTFLLVLFGCGSLTVSDYLMDIRVLFASPDKTGGFFLVYILALIIGGQAGGLLFTKVLEPIMKTQKKICCCKKRY